MNKLFFLFLFALQSTKLFAQECDCASQFEFVKDYYEKNNPAFQKIKADTMAYREYAAGVATLTKKIRAEQSPDRCNIWFERYVSLLKDHHSGVDFKLMRLPIDFNSSHAIDSFKQSGTYKSFKVLKVDSASLVSQLAGKPATGIEGVYTNGSSITFALIEDKKNHYSGIVLKKNKLMDVGHILLELEPTNDSFRFNSVYHTGLFGFNFQKVYQVIDLRNGKIPAYGFYRVGEQPIKEQPVYSFRAIDDSTNYLQLRSFDYSLKDELDGFYESIDSAIRSKPNLVIDLRDNGGGSEQCYVNLLEYIYTQPLKIDQVDVWVSPANIRHYESSPNQAELVRRMKAAQPYSFIPIVEDPVSEWKITGTASPGNIAILFNRKTASSAEGMITYAIQSSKVVTLGENSGGFLGYGNVMTAETPCGNYTLRSTTTRYRDNSRYEFVGIAPMITLQPGTDWVEAARKALANN